MMYTFCLFIIFISFFLVLLQLQYYVVDGKSKNVDASANMTIPNSVVSLIDRYVNSYY